MTTGELIGKTAAEKGINLRQLAISADINYSTLYAIVKRGSQNVNHEILVRVARVLCVPVSYLKQSGLPDEAITEAEIQIHNTINGIVGLAVGEEREEMLYYINSFLEANRNFLESSYRAIKRKG